MVATFCSIPFFNHSLPAPSYHIYCQYAEHFPLGYLGSSAGARVGIPVSRIHARLFHGVKRPEAEKEDRIRVGVANKLRNSVYSEGHLQLSVIKSTSLSENEMACRLVTTVAEGCLWWPWLTKTSEMSISETTIRAAKVCGAYCPHSLTVHRP